MQKNLTEYEFYAVLRNRLQRFRNESGKTQGEMAVVLSIEKSAYAKYETRSKLPAHLIEPISIIVGVPPNALICRNLDADDLDVVTKLRSTKRKKVA